MISIKARNTDTAPVGATVMPTPLSKRVDATSQGGQCNVSVLKRTNFSKGCLIPWRALKVGAANCIVISVISLQSLSLKLIRTVKGIAATDAKRSSKCSGSW